MVMAEDFIIPLSGLRAGKSVFSMYAGNEFFGSFDNPDILNADVRVEAAVEKCGAKITADVSMEGTLTVPCDRCLAPVELPVKALALLDIKFGEKDGDESEDRESVYVPAGEKDYDLSQVVYDYAVLSLPMQRVHPEGKCDSDTVSHLAHVEDTPPEFTDSPFSALKDLLDGKE